MICFSVARLPDALLDLPMRPCSTSCKCLVSQRSSKAVRGNGLLVHLLPNSLISVYKTILLLTSSSGLSPFLHIFSLHKPPVLIIQLGPGASHRASTFLTSHQVPSAFLSFPVTG